MIIHKEAEDVRFIKSNPRIIPRVDLTGIGQLLQCCAIRSGEDTYPGWPPVSTTASGTSSPPFGRSETLQAA
jgi:hypothetical protein